MGILRTHFVSTWIVFVSKNKQKAYSSHSCTISAPPRACIPCGLVTGPVYLFLGRRAVRTGAPRPHPKQTLNSTRQRLPILKTVPPNLPAGLGHCNYVELIDTIFTDVEGVD
jgi:hypothetical protein